MSPLLLVGAAHHGVLERHPAQQRTLHPCRVAGNPGERHAVAEHVFVRLDLSAALRHLLERREHLQRVGHRPTDVQVRQHRRRRLADRAAQRLVGDLAHGDGVAGAVERHAQRDLVAARGVDLDRLGVERLAQTGAVRRPVVIQDDLLVHLLQLHQLTPKKSRAACTPSTSAATSSGVLYTAKVARTVAATPNRRCSGHAQWCPTRTATPRSSSTCPTSWACTPSTTNDTAPPRSARSRGPMIRTPGTCASPSRAAPVSASSWANTASMPSPSR